MCEFSALITLLSLQLTCSCIMSVVHCILLLCYYVVDSYTVITSGQRILMTGHIVILSPLAMANGFVQSCLTPI